MNVYREQLDKCSSIIDKLVSFTKANGTQTQYKRVLTAQLPTSSIYSFLEGRLPHPSHTYTRLAEMTEAEEKERINKEIGERRTRLGARKDQVTSDVKREVYGKSDLEGLYQNVIDWTTDHEVRRDYEERLLVRAYDTLINLPTDEKSGKREQVAKLARGFVLIKHPYALSWDIHLEWADVESIGHLDVGVLREYVEFFPDKGVSKVLMGYLSSGLSPFPAPPPSPVQDDISDDDVGGGVSLNPTSWSAEDRLVLMTDGLADAKLSVLAHRLMAEYYFHLEEFESVVETVRSGLKALGSESRKSGLKLQNDLDALNTMLGTALVRYQSPRHHAEAKTLFNDILKRKPAFTPALIGVGLVLEEEEEYEQAIDYLTQALQRDPTNTRVGIEAAWCRALNGDLDSGLKELEGYLEQIDPEDRDLRAETLYRIGKCQWDIDPLRANRKDRKGPYTRFLASIRSNINYAPAYTMLGIYYADYAKDKKRARQCFQKAFELSPSEVEAAERLARSFADQGDWDIVEIIAQRVVESGKTRPPPGSKKKGFSWPYSALGVVQMNKQEYQQSIVSFLAALRISPDDYHSYVGLGESYHNSGRYNSAARTFNYAENPEDGVKMNKTGESWFTKYMLANVNRELGAYDDAIKGYKEVLESKEQEFGVEIALLQTYLERAWHCIDTGFFGGAVDSAQEALDIATGIAEYLPQAFNLWKGVADACALYSVVQEKMEALPAQQVKDLLEKSFDTQHYEAFADVDGVGADALKSLTSSSSSLSLCITASILAEKRAISSCAHDIHAQAVSWYNLGWTEYRAHISLERQAPQTGSTTNSKTPTRFLKASMRCFKRAIELEAGNAEFWNALGVVTTQLNPKVAQHSLVRSLHLNERNVKAWTNLGVLYLLQKDYELAHQAFARAQSTDPDYAHAWLGEGLVALLWGDVKEALVHFTHAFEISESSSVPTKKEYAARAFDNLISNASVSANSLNLIQPIFALQQLHALTAGDLPFEHLSALFNERIGSHGPAIETLTELCETLEAEFEETESTMAMTRFAHAKSDLARNHLAAKDYAAAAEEASTALDLTADAEETPMPAETRHKIRLSARLTLGLANYYLQNMDDALSAFRKALEESNASPDVVCLLAEVLWAKGGENERSVAREQLFECVAREPGHVGCVVLLGAMATLDEDPETVDAVRDELEGLRVAPTTSERDLSRVERVLEAMSALHSSAFASQASSDGSPSPELVDAQVSVLMYPWKPNGWRKLGREADDGFPKDMALKTAERSVPPRGTLEAGDLAEAYAGTGRVRDAQKAVMVAPWLGVGWSALAEGVSAG
jgi:superkiller protein 3